MRRTTIVVCFASLLVATTPASAAPRLDLPALTRVAWKLSGLKPKRKVAVVELSPSAFEKRALQVLDRDYPRDQQAYDETVYAALGLLRESEALRPTLVDVHVRGVRSLYDPIARKLYIRRGASANSVLRGLVHALEDQSFDLRRLSPLRRGKRDAALAAAAAVEGSTALFTDALTSRALASHGGSRISLFLRLESEFASATGLRFAATLKNLGGTRAVHGSLRRLPTTTEQIFHVDAYLSREEAGPLELPAVAGGMTLERQDSFGELDVRALLAIYQVPRLDHAGEGWSAGRSAVYRDLAGTEAVAIALDWETDRDALEWREATFAFVNDAFHADEPGPPATVPCEADACWSLGTQIAFVRAGARTALVFGRSAPQVVAVARSLAARS